jgi:hypothetical protein
MVETIGDNAQGESLDLGLRLSGSRTVCEDARQLRDLGEPPPVVLTVDVHAESHQMILLPPDCSPENTKISGEAPVAPCFVRCIFLFCGGIFSVAPQLQSARALLNP